MTDASIATATQQAADICDSVAHMAARESGVPVSVLQAITRTETGRHKNGALQPWPWTVNMEGKGVWFDTEDQARSYVFKHFKRGARSFDVGCFQINYKWHGQAFRSIDEMFDPQANARYAAGFLKQLYDETGNWSDAAGAFHSRTPKYADKYKARFDRLLTALVGTPVPQQAGQPADDPGAKPQAVALRVNTFPLLQAGAQTGSMGSLVPIRQSDPARRLVSFIAPEG